MTYLVTWHLTNGDTVDVSNVTDDALEQIRRELDWRLSDRIRRDQDRNELEPSHTFKIGPADFGHIIPAGQVVRVSWTPERDG